MYKVIPVLLLALSQFTSGQNTMQTASERLRALDNLSAETDHGSLQSTRNFMEALVQITSFKSLNPDAVDRCVRNEVSFHSNNQSAVTEQQVVRAVNDLLSVLAVPGSKIVSQEQVRYTRIRLLPLLPTLMQSPDHPTESIVSEKMTPASALFLASFIVHQKMTLPVWQKSPEVFMQEVESASIEPPKSTQHSVSAYQVPNTAAVSFQNFKIGIADPSSDAAQSFQKFLDDLGLAK